MKLINGFSVSAPIKVSQNNNESDLKDKDSELFVGAN